MQFWIRKSNIIEEDEDLSASQDLADFIENERQIKQGMIFIKIIMTSVESLIKVSCVFPLVVVAMQNPVQMTIEKTHPTLHHVIKIQFFKIQKELRARRPTPLPNGRRTPNLLELVCNYLEYWKPTPLKFSHAIFTYVTSERN